jgi:hypothetical protein
MFRCPSNGYGQPHPTANYHRTHSGEHVTTKVAQKPCHAGGAVQQHHVVHKESSFKELDGGNKAPAANRRCFDNYPMNAANNANHHRYEAYEETYEETNCEEETYAYGAGRHHGHGSGGGGRRFQYQTHEETYEEEEEEVVVGGGGGAGWAQLRRPSCRA